MKYTIYIFCFSLLFACRYPVTSKIYTNQARYTALNKVIKTNLQESNTNTQQSDVRPNHLTTKLTLLFDYNVFKISNNNLSELEIFFNKLSSDEKLHTKYYIEGHADQSGSDAYNMTLSRFRAESVKHHLMVLGIPNDNLLILPKGETQPITTNSDQAFKNRRVSIYTSY